MQHIPVKLKSSEIDLCCIIGNLLVAVCVYCVDGRAAVVAEAFSVWKIF